MAAVLTLVHGFEQEEQNAGFYSSVGGTPSLQTTVSRGGRYAYLAAAAATPARIGMAAEGLHDNVGGSDTTAKFIVGFAFRLTDLTPGSASSPIILKRVPGTGDHGFQLNLKSNGDFAFIDANGTEVATGTPSITVNTWHYAELYVAESDTVGAAELFIDNASVFSTSSQDFLHASGASTTWDFQGFDNTSGNPDIYFDDIYGLVNCDAATDRLSDSDQGMEVIPYYGHTSSTELGDAVDTGNWLTNTTDMLNWAIASVSYTSAKSGGYETDGAQLWDGPSGDARITGDILAAEYIGAFERSNGSGTSHSFNVGNDGDGFTAYGVTLSTTPDHISVLYESATVVPTSTEHCQHGMNRGSGGRDMFCYALVTSLLHRPLATGGGANANYYCQVI